MDGALIATVISSSVIVGGAIGGGFWRVMVRIGKQDKSIGKLDGKIEGLNTTMQNFQGQLNGIDGRIDRLDGRINGLINTKG